MIVRTIAVLFFSIGLQTAHAAKDRGGGSVVFIEKKPVLLDLFIASQKSLKKFSDKHKYKIHNENGELDQFELKLIDNSQSVKSMLVQHQPAFSLVQKKLNRWKKSSPLLVDAIFKVIPSLEWFVTNQRLKDIETIVNPKNLMNLKLTTAAAYITKFRGTVISVPIWNALGELSQAGLIIHEALRHIQLSQIFYSATILTDEDVRVITSTLLLEDNSTFKSLDKMYFNNEEQMNALKHASDFNLVYKLRQISACKNISFYLMSLLEQNPYGQEVLRTCNDVIRQPRNNISFLSTEQAFINLDRGYEFFYANSASNLRKELENLYNELQSLVWSYGVGQHIRGILRSDLKEYVLEN